MPDMIEEDHLVSIRELSDQIGEGKTTTDVILKERLKMNKVCARCKMDTTDSERKIRRQEYWH